MKQRIFGWISALVGIVLALAADLVDAFSKHAIDETHQYRQEHS